MQHQLISCRQKINIKLNLSMCGVLTMALEINWDAAENRQVQIAILKERYDNVCKELINEQREIEQCTDTKRLARHRYNFDRLEQKKQGFRRVLLQKYGVKLDNRGRPPLPPDKRLENNQTKLTVRIKKENAEYVAALKRDKLIDNYGQLFDFLIMTFKQQSGHS